MGAKSNIQLNVNNLVVSTILQGSLSEFEFEILLSMTSITSEKVIDALRDFAVHGVGAPAAYGMAGISQQAYERAFKVINLVFRKNETLWEMRYTTTVKRCHCGRLGHGQKKVG